MAPLLRCSTGGLHESNATASMTLVASLSLWATVTPYRSYAHARSSL